MCNIATILSLYEVMTVFSNYFIIQYHKTGLYKNRELVEEIQDHHVQCCKLVQYKIDYCLCLLSYCKNASVY